MLVLKQRDDLYYIYVKEKNEQELIGREIEDVRLNKINSVQNKLETYKNDVL